MHKPSAIYATYFWPIWHRHWPAVWSRRDLTTATLYSTARHQQHPEVAVCAEQCSQNQISPLRRRYSESWTLLLRLVCNLRSRDHVTPASRELHWLPIAARVQYKLYRVHQSILVHSSVAPDYVRDMLHPASERMSQSAYRSATNNEMLVPRSRLKFGKRAFNIAAPREWNSLPLDLRATVNAGIFTYAEYTAVYTSPGVKPWYGGVPGSDW